MHCTARRAAPGSERTSSMPPTKASGTVVAVAPAADRADPAATERWRRDDQDPRLTNHTPPRTRHRRSIHQAPLGKDLQLVWQRRKHGADGDTLHGDVVDDAEDRQQCGYRAHRRELAALILQEVATAPPPTTCRRVGASAGDGRSAFGPAIARRASHGRTSTIQSQGEKCDKSDRSRDSEALCDLLRHCFSVCPPRDYAHSSIPAQTVPRACAL
jgi:hypothetical protein